MANPKENKAFVEDFILAINLILRRARATTPADLRDFSMTQKAVLSRLSKEGPATSADLARAESVKPQSMGAAIAALEDLGFVERKAHPTDGRQVNISLTSKGMQAVKSARAARHAWIEEAIEKLSKQEQATLFKAGELMKKIAEL